ncbi:hypothetical protein RIF29_30301 [Crotalaria pallida]|uniref:Uncharacterized protein n=1 Tax=Crotalaria pallida TaxID=3830 RepID=A0AAN9EID2_CROPI
MKVVGGIELKQQNIMNENHASNLSHSPSTIRRQGGWRAIRYILANETFEKLASMGLIANLVVYMHTQYNIETTTSAQVFTIWSGFTNFLPLVGAYVADAYVGKYNTLLFSSISSFLGMGFIALGAGVPSLRPPSCPTNSDCIPPTGGQLAILYTGLALFAIGSGGLRPCNIAFGADQVDVTTETGKSQLESFLNWWYFLFTIALLFALTVVVYIQTSVSWFVGFIIPTACFACSLTIFILGSNTYIRTKPKGSVISDLVKVIVVANRKRQVDIKKDSELSFYDPPLDYGLDPNILKLPHTNRLRFFDKAAVITDQSVNVKSVNNWRLCSVQQVEELKSVLSTLPVWFAGIVCFLAMTQTNSFGILQALQINKTIGPKFSVPPAWVGLVPMISLSIWILVYEKIVVPLKGRRNENRSRLSMELRLLIGVLLSIVCMVVSGLVEAHRRAAALKHGSIESPIKIWWLIPQFALSGLIEAFAAVMMMELLTSYWPPSMKTLGGAVFFLSLAICNYFNSILIEIIRATTGKNGSPPWLGGNDLNKNRLDYYYYTIAVFAGLNLVYYLFIARHYLKIELLQRSSNKVQPEDDQMGNSDTTAHT